MKLMGAILILCGAAAGYWNERKNREFPLVLCRALVEDLAVLRREICVYRVPIPEILAQHLTNGPGAEYLWQPLSEKLCKGPVGMEDCWLDIVSKLPCDVAGPLRSVGAALANGGEPLSRMIDEARSELVRTIHRGEARRTEQERIHAALYFGCALLAVLAFL